MNQLNFLDTALFEEEKPDWRQYPILVYSPPYAKVHYITADRWEKALEIAKARNPRMNCCYDVNNFVLSTDGWPCMAIKFGEYFHRFKEAYYKGFTWKEPIGWQAMNPPPVLQMKRTLT